MARCSECGYLALRDKDSRELKEAEGEYRKRGLRIAKYEYIPICFVQIRSFKEELIKKKGASNLDNINVINEISEEIECRQFQEWKQGWAPKEHMEMLDRETMLKWQEQQRKDDRRWRIIELIVLGFMAVIVAGGFTVLGAFIERGSLFP